MRMTSSNLAGGERRSRGVLAALLLGLPVAALALGVIHFGPVPEDVRRYVKHPVEAVEVAMFCVALGALGAKWWHSRAERRACRGTLLPAWDGRPVPVTHAPMLAAELRRLPAWVQGSWLGRRVAAMLDFLTHRGTTAGLDDQLRALAEEDALALENSYTFTRFLTWAMPILGFLGTVLGITESISGVTPEKLESDLSQVTDGLALAFDATALALALTMATMFLSFLVERLEQGLLQQVDRHVEQQLAHRFETGAAGNSEYLAALRENSAVLLHATEELVRRQAELWAGTLGELANRREETDQRHQALLTQALEAALTRTLEAHARHVAELELRAGERGRLLLDGLNQVAGGVAGQVEALTRLQEQEGQLARLQVTLASNLDALAGSGAFEQAVENLTAAIHLLTARAVGAPATGPRPHPRPGAAA
jgi:TRAP-type C4-dicarboxylate transport system permease small subunit